MARLKVVKKEGTVIFEYFVDDDIIASTTKNTFLAALDKFIDYDGINGTNWAHERAAPDPNSNPTSYAGLDGRQYKTLFPTIFWERIDTGDLNIMGGQIYTYSRIYDIWDGLDWIISAADIYVPHPMVTHQTLSEWMTSELFVGSTDASSGGITGLKELTTGYIIALSKLNLLLSLEGTPQNSANPIEIVNLCYLIKVLFDMRSSSTKTISSIGEIS